MSGRSRSLATMLFFEAQLLGMDEVPDRAIIDLKAPLGKLGNQPTYCEVLLPDPLQKPLAMLTGNRFWLVATHLAGGNAAGLAHPPHPIDHRTDAQTKLRRRPVARQPTLLNRRDYTLTKIKRIWSAHRMLASNPASILNQNQPDLGIPIRFRLKSSRFSHCTRKRPVGDRPGHDPSRWVISDVGHASASRKHWWHFLASRKRHLKRYLFGVWQPRLG